MRKYAWRSVAVVLFVLCMNVTVHAAYFAYTETVTNQIQLNKVIQEMTAASFHLLKNDTGLVITSGSNAEEKMEVVSGSNAEAKAEIVSESNAKENTGLASDSNADKI